MDDYRAALGATEALVSMYDEEEQNHARALRSQRS